MDKKLLELYEKCEEHNIKITIISLSDSIEVTGWCPVYHKGSVLRDILRSTKWINIEELRTCETDLFEGTINEIIREIVEQKEKGQKC